MLYTVVQVQRDTIEMFNILRGLTGVYTEHQLGQTAEDEKRSNDAQFYRFRLWLSVRANVFCTMALKSRSAENSFPFFFSLLSRYLTLPIQVGLNDTGFGVRLFFARCITHICLLPVLFF